MSELSARAGSEGYAVRDDEMSGAAPFGFKLEPTVIQGIRTKMMAPDGECADIAHV